jgi:hypothetical protein
MHPTRWRFTHKNKDGEVLWQSDWQQNFLTDEGEEHLLNCYFSQSGTVPAAFYMGLINDSGIAETDTLTTMAGEPSGDGYSRQATTFSDASFVGGDYETPSTTETFTADGGQIGPVDHAIITDASSGTAGLLIIVSPLSTSRTLEDGDSLEVDVDVTAS